jgi:hypothetical protein
MIQAIAKQHRRGTIYLPLLATTMLVGVVALASIGLTQVQSRRAQQESDWAAAQLQAQNAIEGGLYFIDSRDTWRSMLNMGSPTLGFYIGPNIATVDFSDPVDGDIGDSDEDDIVLTATGIKGDARHQTQVTVQALREPLAALGSCLHAAGDMEIKGGAMVTVQSAPISTNGNAQIDGTVFGDVSALTASGGGFVSGSLAIGASPADMPDASVIDIYASQATTILNPGGTIEEFALGPGVNPWGVVNADGVYVIDTEGHDITIKDARIWGTLIIRTNGHQVKLQNAVFMQPFRSDYPVLIVDGDLKIETENATKVLDEAGANFNFNPVELPFEGVSDADLTDTYPNEIHGLIHVTGEFELDKSPYINGAIICEGPATIQSSLTTLVHDESLYNSPPEGYTTIEMRIAPGTWRQVVD